MKAFRKSWLLSPKNSRKSDFEKFEKSKQKNLWPFAASNPWITSGFTGRANRIWWWNVIWTAMWMAAAEPYNSTGMRDGGRGDVAGAGGGFLFIIQLTSWSAFWFVETNFHWPPNIKRFVLYFTRELCRCAVWMQRWIQRGKGELPLNLVVTIKTKKSEKWAKIRCIWRSGSLKKFTLPKISVWIRSCLNENSL